MSGGLSNNFIDITCKKLFKNFIGVYPCDLFPNTRKKKYSVIFNTGDSSTPGEHFVAIYVNNKTIYYFDSFGKKPTDENIKAFINKTKKNRRFYHWKRQVQHIESNYCGFFCIGFLFYKHMNIRKFSYMFHPNNLHINDKLIVDFIIDNIK